MAKFKRTEARIPFASKQKVKRFGTELVDCWVANKYSAEEVHDRAQLMMADAVSGTHMVDDKPVYARVLGSILKAEGCFLPGTQGGASASVIKDSPYA